MHDTACTPSHSLAHPHSSSLLLTPPQKRGSIGTYITTHDFDEINFASHGRDAQSHTVCVLIMVNNLKSSPPKLLKWNNEQ